MSTSETVQPTQGDREFAASIFIAVENAEACRRGERDDHPIVQRAARHRLAGMAAGREEAAKHLEGRASLVAPDGKRVSQVDQHTAFVLRSNAATIRSLGDA